MLNTTSAANISSRGTNATTSERTARLCRAIIVSCLTTQTGDIVTKPRWKYSGDVNLQYGGVFWNPEGAQFDSVEAVRITPCSDAGGPDNIFWIERLSVNLPDDDHTIADVLSICGYSFDGYKGYTKAERLSMLVDACIAYGKYDTQDGETVKIGKDDPFFTDTRGEWKAFRVDTQLRGGSSLRNYVKRKYLND